MTIDASLNKRLARVVRKHERMRTNGVVHKVGKDGLIQTRPRLIRPRFPLKGALVVLGLLIAFKALMYAQMGESEYVLRVEELKSGGLVDQAGAVLMQLEPLTQLLGGLFDQYFL